MNEVEGYIFNGFRYYSTYKNDALPLVEHDKIGPEYLYKYYPLFDYHVESLVNSHFYASHPFELNDILDSSLFLFFASQPIEFNVYEKFYDRKGKTAFDTKEELRDFYNKDTINGCTDYIFHVYGILSYKFGIISLSENENDPLMWPHYTQEKGFQIKFNSQLLADSIQKGLPNNGGYVGLFPMNYTERLEPIDISKFRGIKIPFIYSTNVKLDKWKYENEWRFIVSKPKMGVPSSKLGFSVLEDHDFNPRFRYINYGIESVESICLGMNFFPGRDFSVQKKSEMEYEVEPKQGENFCMYIKLLDFFIDSFKEKIFLSVVKKERDKDGTIFLKRSKERVEIERIGLAKYKILRTVS